MMAHQERGVGPLQEEDGPRYVSNALAHSTFGPNRVFLLKG